MLLGFVMSMSCDFNESLTNNVVSFEQLGPDLLFFVVFTPPPPPPLSWSVVVLRSIVSRFGLSAPPLLACHSRHLCISRKLTLTVTRTLSFLRFEFRAFKTLLFACCSYYLDGTFYSYLLCFFLLLCIYFS